MSVLSVLKGIFHGQRMFHDSLDSVLEGTGCYWALIPAIEKKRYRSYNLGKKKCSKSNGRCGIEKFLQEKLSRCRKLLEFLDGLDADQRTEEINSSREFLRKIIEDTANATSLEPCMSVGDLLIALESDNFENFYTKNYKESIFFCDFFGQNLIYRPNNPSKRDVTCASSMKPWDRNSFEK
jgi:hypothetical protein